MCDGRSDFRRLEDLDGRARRVEDRIERVGHDDGRRLVLLGHIGKRLGDVKSDADAADVVYGQ